jgi:hypothetical protein
MQNVTTVKQKVYQTLDTLPPQGLKELDQFLDFLKYKYQIEHRANIIALGGMWQDLPFDVTDEEVRALRRRVTDTLLSKV